MRLLHYFLFTVHLKSSVNFTFIVRLSSVQPHVVRSRHSTAQVGLHVQDGVGDISHEPFSGLGLVNLSSADCCLSFLLAHSPPLFSETLLSPCLSPTSLIIPSYRQLVPHACLKELAFPKVLSPVHCLSLSTSFTWKLYPFFTVLTMCSQVSNPYGQA